MSRQVCPGPHAAWLKEELVGLLLLLSAWPRQDNAPRTPLLCVTCTELRLVKVADRADTLKLDIYCLIHTINGKGCITMIKHLKIDDLCTYVIHGVFSLTASLVFIYHLSNVILFC